MKKKTPNKKIERRGRPKTTGTGEAQFVRMHKPQLDAIDSWRSASISRPEAIRQLVAWALGHTQRTT